MDTNRSVAEDRVPTEGGKASALRPTTRLVLGDENLQHHIFNLDTKHPLIWPLISKQECASLFK